jgi:hypothetical protein
MYALASVFAIRLDAQTGKIPRFIHIKHRLTEQRRFSVVLAPVWVEMAIIQWPFSHGSLGRIANWEKPVHWLFPSIFNCAAIGRISGETSYVFYQLTHCKAL